MITWSAVMDAIREFSNCADAALTAAAGENLTATSAMLARAQVRLETARSALIHYIATTQVDGEAKP